MAKQDIRITAEGYEELKNELDELKTVRRAAVAEKIKTARGFGDLSENSEYDEARNEQAQLEGRIQFLEEQLKSAVIIDKNEQRMDAVDIGAHVKVYDCQYDEELEFDIVSGVEGGQSIDTITDGSPVGEALMGHKAGEEVEVHAPKGTFKMKILEISFE